MVKPHSIALLVVFVAGMGSVACTRSSPLAPSGVAPSSGASLFNEQTSLGVLVRSGSAVSIPFSRYGIKISVTLDPSVTMLFWEFGDGTSLHTFATVMDHAYPSAGRFHAFLTATTGDGRSERVDGFIDVPEIAPPTPPPPAPGPIPPPPIPPPPPPPTPSAPFYGVQLLVSPSVIVQGQATTFTALVDRHGGAPEPTLYEWDCTLDGTFDASTTVNAHACFYAHPGTYVALVRVSNGDIKNFATVPVTVLEF